MTSRVWAETSREVRNGLERVITETMPIAEGTLYRVRVWFKHHHKSTKYIGDMWEEQPHTILFVPKTRETGGDK